MSDYTFSALNEPVDISKEFIKQENTYFNAMQIRQVNPNM